METEILRMICAGQGAVNTEDLVYNLFSGDPTKLSEIICNREKFLSCCPNGQPKVVARTRLRLCRVKDCLGICRSLHLCKNILFSGFCQFTQLRRGCSFSHELTSEHNQRLLRQHELESLSREELCTLLLQSDHTVLPDICHDYNNGVGLFGRCQDGDGCKRLHICETYISRECSCWKNHDFNAPQPFRALQARGVPDTLFQSLKAAYANKQALRLARVSDHGQRSQRGRGRGGHQLSRGWRDTWGNSGFRGNRGSHSSRWVQDQACSLSDIAANIDAFDLYSSDGLNESDDENSPTSDISSTSPAVHFDTMTCGLKKVRRLSTENSVTEPTFIHTTEWLWYWQDEFGKWNMFASAIGGHEAADINSTKLEKLFLANNKDVVEFSAGSHSYSLSFEDMMQTNNLNGTKTLVCRRPRFVSAVDVRTKKVRRPVVQNAGPVPDNWDKTQIPETGYSQISLQSSSREFKEVEALFCKTMRGFDIVNIDRIQNQSLWEAFQLQKNQMRTKNQGRDVPELRLFHGIDSKSVNTICHNNFDCRTHGMAYGKGSYFARDAKCFDIVNIERIQNQSLWEAFQLQKNQMRTKNQGRDVPELRLFHGIDSKSVNTICHNNFDCRTHGMAYGKGSYFARDAKYSHDFTGDADVRAMFISQVLVGDYTKGSFDYCQPPSKDGGDINFYDSCVDDVMDPAIFVVFEKHQIYPEYLIQYN
ncbi:protein mono-ADP-ribosyltransferase PARP12-like [Neolamprologus brichardi]|uniref:protein mono-ADP-ribosyltransferase PARP12-like n=1 Tax=Neolamprologus brichardi TaxID=32507 RepID=UPI001643A303|nr:protein mono-ADP-ribosyltransferase PARP12-like [Neolamprologus brichardi]